MRTFESEHLSWSNGEIPKCSFCERNFDDCQDSGGLYETSIQNTLVCGEDECVIRYSQETVKLIEETTQDE